MFNCPIDKSVYDISRDAIDCWRSHDTDLFRTNSLAEIGRKVGGLSRERVRQLANSMNETARLRPYRDSSRGLEAEAMRRTQAKKYHRKTKSSVVTEG